MSSVHFPAAIDCGNLADPESGQVTFTPGVVMTLETGLDAIANYTCNEGYDLVGDAMRTCQADEQWTGTEPNCTCKQYTVSIHTLMVTAMCVFILLSD